MGNTMDTKIEKLIKNIASIIHFSLSDSILHSLVQFVKFGLIGVTNTAISYVLNVLVLLILKPYGVAWDYIAGNLISFFLSVLWSFYWNNKYVFTLEEGRSRNIGKALLKTYISYGFTGIFLNNILSYLWIEKLGISKYIAPLINLIVSVPLNFLINKFWAFEDK